MTTLNDWFVNESVKDVSVEAGDEVRFMYTCKNMGADLGADYNGNDKTVKDIEFEGGVLDKAFDKDIHEYTLTVPNGTQSVMIKPTASNKNFQVKTYIGETEYKRTEVVPVIEGTVITVKCGDPSWPSMSPNTGEAQRYTFAVVFGDVTLPQKGYLSEIKFGVESTGFWKMEPEFSPDVYEYNVYALDSNNFITFKSEAKLSANAPEGSKITVTYKPFSGGASKKVTLTSKSFISSLAFRENEKQ